MKKVILLVMLCIGIGVTFAHQPRLVFTYPVGQTIQINKPEVSQAFYGILSGQEDVYQITSTTGFLLYVSLVVPKFTGTRTDFTVDVMEGNMSVYTRLDGKNFTWTDFFEPFAGDMYLQGPSLEKNVGPGVYTIKVSNSDNQGKYSLAIGKIESFPLNETIHTYKVLPELKTVFFGKPWYMMFRNIVGGSLLGLIILLIFGIWGSTKFIKHIVRKRRAGL